MVWAASSYLPLDPVAILEWILQVELHGGHFLVAMLWQPFDFFLSWVQSMRIISQAASKAILLVDW